MSLDLAAESIALRGIGADFHIQIQHQQFVAVAVAEHVHEGVVAIEQLALGVGDVNAFLYLLEEQAISFFGGAALGDVAYDVDGAFLRAALLGVRGS